MKTLASRRWLLASCAVALWLGCAGPVREPTPASPIPAPTRRVHPLAWEARDIASGGALYLLGSVHLAPGQTPKLGPRILDAYDRSEELVVEVDLSAASPDEMAAASAAMMVLPEGTTLDQVLSFETHLILQQYLEGHGIPAQSMDRLKPWAVSVSLSVMQLRWAGFEAEYGVDRAFIDSAVGGKRIVPLETVVAQLEMLDGLPADLQETMLVETIQGEAMVADQMKEVMRAWEMGDEAKMLEFFLGPPEERERLKILHERVYFQRNERMAKQLERMARDGKTRFVVVGAGHVVGPRGIPALLSRFGFRVERLREEAAP